MTAKEILNKHYNVDEGFTNFESDAIVEAMKEYAKQELEQVIRQFDKIENNFNSEVIKTSIYYQISQLD